MMKNIIYSPPFAFIIVFFTCVLFSSLCKRLSFKKRYDQKESKKAYACGENFDGHMIQPDYSQFFPFAFFFTILHVVALIIATIPAETIESFSVAVLYIGSAVIGLLILLRK